MSFPMLRGHQRFRETLYHLPHRNAMRNPRPTQRRGLQPRHELRLLTRRDTYTTGIAPYNREDTKTYKPLLSPSSTFVSASMMMSRTVLPAGIIGNTCSV